MNDKALARFMRKVEKSSDETGCWLWMGATRVCEGYRYGRFYFEGKTVSAHRVMFDHVKGKVTKAGRPLLHKCENTTCVNPNHVMLKPPIRRAKVEPKKVKEKLL